MTPEKTHADRLVEEMQLIRNDRDKIKRQLTITACERNTLRDALMRVLQWHEVCETMPPKLEAIVNKALSGLVV